MASAGTVYIDFEGRFDNLLRNSRRYGGQAGDGFAGDFSRRSEKGVLGSFKKMAGAATAIFAGAQVVSLFGDMIEEAREAAKVTRLTEAVLKSTGGVAKVSADDVDALSSALSKKAGIDDELIASGANLLLTFTKVRNEAGEGNDIFNQTTEAALDMSAALGTDMTAASMQLGKALNDPIKGLTTLGRAGIQFSEDQKTQIRTMVEAGDVLGAQKIILGELTTQFGGAAEAAADPIQKLGVMWGNFLEGVGAKILPWVEKATTAIGEWMPEAIARGGAAFGELRDRAVEFGTDLWERVEPAVSDVRDALMNLQDIGASLWEDFAPLAEDLAMLGGAAIIGGILGIAAALEEVTGFLARNEGLVRVFVGAIAGLAALKAWGLIVSAIETIYIRWLYLTGTAILQGVGKVVGGLATMSTSFLTMGQSAGVGGAQARAGLAQISGAINPVAVGVAGLGIALALLYTSWQDSNQAQEEWRSAVEAKIDFTAPESIRAGIEQADRHMDTSRVKIEGWQSAVVAGGKGIAEWLNPWAENTVIDTLKATKASEAARTEFDQMARELEATYSTIGDTLGTTGESVQAWVQKLNLDPATLSVEEMTAAIRDGKSVADSGVPAVEGMAEAFTVLGDETASAADELDAWKTLMDEIMGVHIDFEEAQLGFAGAIHELTDAQTAAAEAGEAWSTNLFGGDSASLETRGVIAGLAEEAIGLAESFGAAGYGAEGAAMKLAESREQIIAAGEAAGISRADMEAYLDTLGLTPENITTAISAQTDLASLSAADQAISVAARARVATLLPQLDEPARATAERYMGQTARERIAPVTAKAYTAEAEAHLASLVRERTVPLRLHIVNPNAASPQEAQWGPPGRAAGGPVRRGMPYIVGEHRPELFIPDQSGTIIPRVPEMAGGPAGEPMDYDRLGDAVARALRDSPPVVELEPIYRGVTKRAAIDRKGRS